MDVLELLRDQSSTGPHCGILTKPPETVLIYFSDNAQSIQLFDSHARQGKVVFILQKQLLIQ